MYWILLAVTHRKLRVDAQQQQIQLQHQLLTWQKESKEQIKQHMNEAVSYLDDQTNINKMSLRQLRNEMQSMLEPQIFQLLNVACKVEEDLILRHNYDGAAHNSNEEEENDNHNYKFSCVEAKEYREILLLEYYRICKLLHEMTNSIKNDDDTLTTSEYYELKKGAIETLLRYFDWVPMNTSLSSVEPKYQIDEQEDYVDEFGFYPNRSDSKIVAAMRYYHVRNIVRSHKVRTLPIVDTEPKANDTTNDGGGHYTYSILPFKSTIPNAGRGVFIDGFAPAGTLLSFFPGKVWPKEHLMTTSLQTQMQFSENDPRHQLSMRYDDILIDSRRSPYTVVMNLWALGHIVNHPPPPMSTTARELGNDHNTEMNESNNFAIHFQPYQGPNCVTASINFTEGLFTNHSGKLRDYIPNEYELPPKSWARDVFEKEKVMMHGMGLIALRDLKDEELFFDYRMSPNEKANGSKSVYPSWYHVWDVDAATNRWSNSNEAE
jgi:hypothetical protein